ncbi:MAG: type II secretion system protein [Phycisphaerae bacterium]
MPRRAFTLIELLVVIAILAMLLTILLPSLQQARETAKDTLCLTHMKELGVAMHLYAGDARDTLPSSETWVDHATAILHYDQPADAMTRTRSTMPKILFCPLDPDPYPKPYMTGRMEVTSYLVNGAETDFAMGTGRRIAVGLFGGACRMDTVFSTSGCLMLGETTNYGKVVDVDHPAAVAAFEAVGASTADARTRFHHRATSSFGHRGKMMVCFVDGHAGGVRGQPVPSLPPALWPGGALMTDAFTFFPNLSLPTAIESPLLWGPPYSDGEWVHE